MACELYHMCETREEARDLMEAIAQLFGAPNAHLITAEQSLLMLPDVSVRVRKSRATDVARPFQMFIQCPNAGHLSRVKVRLNRRKTKRIRKVS